GRAGGTCRRCRTGRSTSAWKGRKPRFVWWSWSPVPSSRASPFPAGPGWPGGSVTPVRTGCSTLAHETRPGRAGASTCGPGGGFYNFGGEARGPAGPTVNREIDMRIWLRNVWMAVKTVGQGMWITLWYFLQTYKRKAFTQHFEYPELPVPVKP